ncbi:MAG: hypothetical protein RL228_375 [Actinomycetota bacterium]|jgi:hypothetical protein
MASTFGDSSRFLDEKLSKFIGDDDRANIWNSVNNLLDRHDENVTTTMGLGYVQSGKTTSISALCAAASDRGFKVVIAILGSTVLLKDQNRRRVEENLGFSERNYRWGIIEDLQPKRSAADIKALLAKDRTVFIPVIKNATILRKLAAVLSDIDALNFSTLIIDDEADQASLNTRPSADLASSTNQAIQEIRQTLPRHLYVQYTATPYAPLLLNLDDPLMPEHVEFLQPGTGYTGGREFFIENRDRVIRIIPESDEQRASSTLGALPVSLQQALASYFVGSSYLFTLDEELAPISMLIHSTFKNDLQDRYKFLVDRYIRAMQTEDDLSSSPFAELLNEERSRLHLLGVQKIDDDLFWKTVTYVLKEATVWLVNSATEVKKINWNLAPFHILIGGNKLDRGFTVEGLTVSYMNRPASEQIDTLEQRARAFGYRNQLLPFCQFYATARTLKLMTEIVHTEDDLRVNLQAYLEQGKSVREWATEIGLLLPAGSKPSRKSVVPALKFFNSEGDWHALRRPLVDAESKISNLSLLEDLGVFQASEHDFGRLSFKTKLIPLPKLCEFIESWTTDPASSGWRQDEIVSYLRRFPDQNAEAIVVLLENDGERGGARVRKWEPDLGFINLFQGRDTDLNRYPFYPGDRELGFEDFGRNRIILQVHHVTRRGFEDTDLFTLAIHLGDKTIVSKDRGI